MISLKDAFCRLFAAITPAPVGAPPVKPSGSQLNRDARPSYVCPMRPQVLREAPCFCPECDLELGRKPTATDWIDDMFSVGQRWPA